MAKFSYTATNSQGKTIKGVKEGRDQEDIANFLHEQGLVVIAISEKVGFSWEEISSIQIGGVPLKDRVIFTKQLSTMLSAGLPLIQSLEILVQQAENKFLRGKLERIYRDVASGVTLSEAFRKESAIFNTVQLNLLVAGETSGNLNEMMLKIAGDMEKGKQLRGKVLGAMIYPAILLVVLVAVVAAMLIFMVPAVEDLYTDFGDAELPGVTQLLVNMSNFVTSPGGIVIMFSTVVFTVLGFRYYYSTSNGRRVIDRYLLKIPVVGNLIQKVQLAEFNRLLSMLMKSGVPIVDSLRIVSDALSNSAYSDLVKQAVIEVSKGNPISLPLAKDEVFPLMLLKMLATGEETGKLDQVTEDMGKFYDQEVEEITANLTKLMEPLIMVLVGGAVAFLAIAIYLPIFQLGQLAQ